MTRQARPAERNLAGKTESVVINYRNGIRATLWVGAIFGILTGLALGLWGVLSLAGDYSGAVVARVLSLVCGIAAGADLVVLLVMLARLQLTMLEADEPLDKGSPGNADQVPL